MVPLYNPIALIMGGLGLPGAQDLVPDAGVPPAPEARGDGAPRSVALGQIPPRGPGAQDPEDTVEDGAMVLGRATGARPLRREERSKPRPLGIGQLVVSHPSRIPL